jgi:HSP20 family molecular chaperone IbpA
MSSLWSDPFELLTKGFPRLRVSSLDLPDGVWRPKVDFKQNEKEITIHVEVPGVASKQLNVEVSRCTCVTSHIFLSLL